MPRITILSTQHIGDDQVVVTGTADGVPFTHTVWHSALYGPSAQDDAPGGGRKPITTNTQRRAFLKKLLLRDCPALQPRPDVSDLTGEL